VTAFVPVQIRLVTPISAESPVKANNAGGGESFRPHFNF
jgi:hypothetical protein